MADFEWQQLLEKEVGLEFVDWSSTKCNNFSEGSSETKKDVQVIQVRGEGGSKDFWLQNVYQSTDLILIFTMNFILMQLDKLLPRKTQMNIIE